MKRQKLFVSEKFAGKKLTQKDAICNIIISPEIGSKNLTVGYLVLAPKGKTKPNIHPNSEEVFYITRGKGIIKVDDEQKEVEEGDFVFIPSNVWHEFENTEEIPMEWVLILSPPTSSEEYKNSPWKTEG